MNAKLTKIWYSHDESGPAELIGPRQARIVDHPILASGIWQNAIVRLSHEPDEDQGLPAITEVVWSPYPCDEFLRVQDDAEAVTLISVLALLGCDSFLAVPPKDGKAGLLRVAHDEHIDPLGLAEAIGIAQECDDADQGEDGGPDLPAEPLAEQSNDDTANVVPPANDTKGGVASNEQ